MAPRQCLRRTHLRMKWVVDPEVWKGLLAVARAVYELITWINGNGPDGLF
jgi:hypothetical protein